MIKRVLFCSPEVTPYAKTGGLADVSGALPAALRELGVACDVLMPLYGPVKAQGLPLQKVDDIFFPLGAGIAQASIVRLGHVYFIDNDEHFGRGGLYSYASRDYPDNLERFAFFARACVELIPLLGADIVHCNDWQTALIPAYLRALDMHDIVTIFTIHNLAYQGLFDASLWPQLFLPQEFFAPWCLEYYGGINVMKAGIVLSDHVNTVSATYAQEIQRPEFGVGLDGLLRSAAHKLTGIVNGIDVAVWDPAHDPLIAAVFDMRDMSGKQACKASLQQRMGLETNPAAPLFGIITRLVDQKGLDLILPVIPEMAAAGAQVAALGNGEAWYEDRLRELSRAFPGRVSAHIGFDDGLAHAIEAGADFFIMPSRFEPCGLNQMISMRYGTIPIVTPVGGLADTVTALGEGKKPVGLRVKGIDSYALSETVKESIRIFREDQGLFLRLRKNGMERDVSWSLPARRYLEMYSKQKDFKESARI
ncbi:MAG: glycogen synthase GlgA [Syntrophaceae bacterium]